MRIINYLALSVLAISGLAVNSAASAHLSGLVPAQQPNPGAMNLAQLNGQCRLVNRSMGIYEEPRTSSRSFGIVAENQVVILGDGSESGWARIVSPQIGWLDARNLQVIACPSSVAPPERPAPERPTPERPTERPIPERPSGANGRCTVVIYNGVEGLGIYSRPSSSSLSLGSLPARSRVYLTGNTAAEPSGRQWVEIVSGNGDDYGWIPETGPTGPNSGYNIRTLNCTNIVGGIATR